MSGLYGHLAMPGCAYRRRPVAAMAAEVPERAPDGLRFWDEDPLVLAVAADARLPAAPPALAPAFARHARLRCAFAGTLYNRDEIRALLGAGATTDAALVARAWAAWGAAALDRLAADFALAIWDEETRELVLAVDAAGVRQLSWHAGPGGLLFAPEEACLLAASGAAGADPSPRMIRAHLAMTWPAGPETFFPGVERIPGGHLLRAPGGRPAAARLARWWEPRGKGPRFRRRAEYADCFRSLLERCVLERLDDRSALWLSGGLDSGSVAAVAARAGRDLRCVTASFPGLTCDETARAIALSNALGLAHRRVEPENQGLLETARRYLAAQATPFLTPEPVLLDALLAATREAGAAVCLTGMGGDEALASGYALAGWLARGRPDRWAAEVAACAARGSYASRPNGARPALRPLRALRGMGSLGRASAACALPASLTRPFSRGRRRTLRLLGCARRPGRLPHELDSPASWLPQPAPQAGFLEQTHAWRERICARRGVELRHPFLDRRILEFTRDLPPGLLLDRGWTKALLREAMSGLLPEEVRRRNGHAEFSAFARRGICAQGDPVTSFAATSRWVREAEARALVRRYVEGDDTLLWPVWMLVTTELWLASRPAAAVAAGRAAKRPYDPPVLEVYGRLNELIAGTSPFSGADVTGKKPF